jgi:formate dehydrogenase major subunit
MKFNRRGFLKISAAASLATAFGGLGFDLKPTQAKAQLLRTNWAQESTSICCYCAVGCGVLVHSSKSGSGRIINVEGDPDHPVNQGSLCAKGASLYQLAENKNRITSVMYRAPGSDQWETRSWDWALDRIAHKIKEARDETFTRFNSKGQEVNRCDGLASVGSAALDNEECWVYQAMLRSLGLVYIEHQARI